jgi:trigger factor
LNIQTEHLENHTARFTVAVGNERFDKAKKQAARKLSKQYRIPGFRKGKAPYKVMVRYIGEAPIIEEAMEDLGNKVYREALDEIAETVRPYGPGSLEDFKLDPEPTYIFTVPLEPEVELSDYHSIRKDYTAPEVSADDVEETLLQLRRREAETTDSENPVESGDRVTLDIHSEFADGEERPETDGDDDEDADDEENKVPYKGDGYIHRHDQELDLDPDNEPVLPGFIGALVGANIEDTVEFELSVPDDSEYEEIRGRKVQFSVTVKAVQNVTMPELDDDFAAQVTKDEEEPLSLEQLRQRLLENLEKEAVREAENAYANQILDEIVDASTVKYPQTMLDERIEDMLKDLDSNLRQQGIGLEDYIQITGTTRQALQEQYTPEAQKSLERSLVLGEVLTQEAIEVKPEDVEKSIDDMLAQFGEQKDAFRQFFDTPQQRNSIVNNLLYERVMERLTKIGRGESLDEPVDDVSEDANEEAVEETADGDAGKDTDDNPSEIAVETDVDNAETAADKTDDEDTNAEKTTD